MCVSRSVDVWKRYDAQFWEQVVVTKWRKFVNFCNKLKEMEGRKEGRRKIGSSMYSSTNHAAS